MLALTLTAGHTYMVDLQPLPALVPGPTERHHAFVIALTQGKDEHAHLLRFTTITQGDSIGKHMARWQRMGVTHYGVVAERHPEREAQALAAELAQTYGVADN
jgi:hypothetical protein